MALGPENVIVVYRANDSESEYFASRYATLHGLSLDQLVGVPCSAIEVLSNYETFQTEVETPLLGALTSLPLSNYSVLALVLMPRVPGGFYSNTDVISSTSRLSRIHHSFTKKLYNPLYDRRVFKRFDSTDAETALICTRFDSPLSAVTESWFQNIETSIRQLSATGAFYFDGYSAEHGNGSAQYQAELLFFYDSLLQRLGVDIQSTIQIDPYVDPIISSVKDDSFFWGWGADRGSLSFFKATNALRAFFYNADTDGAATMRDIDSTAWPVLAIRQGYVATAGSMSNPGINGYLRPYPFYDALFRGATLGEALMFSVPHLDWTMAFFGDPLFSFTFPQKFNENPLVPFDKAWQEMADGIAQSIINIYRRVSVVERLWEYVVSIQDIQVGLDLYEPVEILKRGFPNDSWRNDYVKMVRAFFNLVTVRNQTAFKEFYPNLSAYLIESGNKVPEILVDTLQNPQVNSSLLADNVETEGDWDFTFTLEHYNSGFAFYHFELEVSHVEDFSEILFSKQSILSQSNWTYENAEGNFAGMGANGVTSSYTGKRVRYSSTDQELLQRGEYYFFRIRQKDQQSTYSWRVFSQLIYR